MSFWPKEELLIEHLQRLCVPEPVLAQIRHGPDQIYLNILAKLCLDKRLTSAIYVFCRDTFAELFNRWQKLDISFSILRLAAVARVALFDRDAAVYAEEIISHSAARADKDSDPLFVLSSESVLTVNDLPADQVKELLLAIFRLLKVDIYKFSPHVSLNQLYLCLQNKDSAIRYLSLRVICLKLHASDATVQRLISHFFGAGPIRGSWETQEINFIFFPAWELRLSKQGKDFMISTLSRAHLKSDRSFLPHHLSDATADIGGFYQRKLATSEKVTSSLIETASTTENLRNLARCIGQNDSVLVVGPGGTGKSSLVYALAQKLGRRSGIVTLHLNDQTDSKALIGVFSASGDSQTFSWSPGVLTKSIEQGNWVLVEDIDKAPSEAISILSSLIRTGRLDLPSQGKTIRPANGFKLIATTKSNADASSVLGIQSTSTADPRPWSPIHIKCQSTDEIWQIVETKFPLLRMLRNPIMSVFIATVQQLSPDLPCEAQDQQQRDQGSQLPKLLKLCQRIHNRLVNDPHISGEQLNDELFWHSVNCFTRQFQSDTDRDAFVAVIGQQLRVPKNRIQLILDERHIKHETSPKSIKIGRAIMPKSANGSVEFHRQRSVFSMTPKSLSLLEQIAVAVENQESVLLVGETGCGKTTVIQHLSASVCQKLEVFNLSQQSEAGDLLGSLRPVNIRSLANSINVEFQDLFSHTLLSRKGPQALEDSRNFVSNGKWQNALLIWLKCLKDAFKALKSPSFSPYNATDEGSDPKRPLKKRKVAISQGSDLHVRWKKFGQDLEMIAALVQRGANGRGFSFVESNFIKAVRNGHWVLLDEINMASPEILESIVSLLNKDSDSSPSILLLEKGHSSIIKAHPNFRLFGAMNPATDVGKKNLPPGLLSRFTEILVRSPDANRSSLLQLVRDYLRSISSKDKKISEHVVDLYFALKNSALVGDIVDGVGHRPHFSLRTLTRALLFAASMERWMGPHRSLYDAFLMAFTTTLDGPSEVVAIRSIQEHIFKDLKRKDTHFKITSVLNKKLVKPSDEHDYVSFYGYWVRKGQFAVDPQDQYIVTPFVQKNLLNLVRAMALRRFPILIQGPTSSGKTSMIRYLASVTGNKFVRINNHEHTDIQEYLGSYSSDENGTLTYQEGVLVRALREGHWIVLDELNLAPTDVLEALNRLLDDNRELFLPETQTVVRPHPDFMLFGTQNPAGVYAGRKPLSRALRNRFIEMFFDDIPQTELEVILHQSQNPRINPRFCSIIASVYRELSIARHSERVLEEKHSFATLRDLFRWAKRPADDYKQLGINGYMLLGERVRKANDKLTVKLILEKHISTKVPGFKIDSANLYALDMDKMYSLRHRKSDFQGLAWTHSLQRLFILVDRAIQNNEPVLLVGETGCGKTTVCQCLASAYGKSLHIMNAHQNMEAGDIIGSQRPIRNKAMIRERLNSNLRSILQDVSGQADLDAASVENLLALYDERRSTLPDPLKLSIDADKQRFNGLFEWVDGSLVRAMKKGSLFLLDEISLAEDSVLERLNSVLEPERQILLAEKSSGEVVSATEGFHLMATMNPGGDYGKKELSPALRNRFTEIWVPPIFERQELLNIVRSELGDTVTREKYPDLIVDFVLWYNERFCPTLESVSIRDIKSWTDLMIASNDNSDISFIQGASLTYIDALGANSSAYVGLAQNSVSNDRLLCLDKLSSLLGYRAEDMYFNSTSAKITPESLAIGPYSISRSSLAKNFALNLDVPSTRLNALRILRALQLNRPILIEGDPGIGKTALITSLARGIGKPYTRINLSEQTDIMDLFGSDIPQPGSSVGHFTWRNGAFLSALQQGHWILLDEINLASQSVLEGLNSCLDHRRSVYIAELDQSFECHPDFRIFGAQNPHRQGGGRKGLPASFVNRFTVVYAEKLTPEDMTLISTSTFPSIEMETVNQVIRLVTEVERKIVQQKEFGSHGSPWEFNLRDVTRWLSLLNSSDRLLSNASPSEYIDLLFGQRLRLCEDRSALTDLARTVLGVSDFKLSSEKRQLFSEDFYQIGRGSIQRDELVMGTCPVKDDVALSLLPYLESIMICIRQRWPCILTGDNESTKLSLIQHLAAISGAEVTELSLNSETDTMDLIGGYEQIDNVREPASILQTLKYAMRPQLLQSFGTDSSASLTLIFDKIEKCLENPTDYRSILSLLAIVSSESSLSHLNPLFEQLHSVTKRDARPFSFEWVDGQLVRAAETGQWLILNDANRCDSSVLDRLNSLLEPNGELILNEQLTEAGEPRVIKPHADFRIFLVIDPAKGELSRAMRNRAVELCVLEDVKTEARNPEVLGSLSQDSWLCRLEILGNTIKPSNGSNVIQPGIDVALSQLSTRTLQMLPRWVGQAEISISAMPSAEISNLSRRIEGLSQYLESDVVTECQEMLERFRKDNDLPSSYTQSHPIHPLSDVVVHSSTDLKTHQRMRVHSSILDRVMTLISMDNLVENFDASDLSENFSKVNGEKNTMQSYLHTFIANLLQLLFIALGKIPCHNLSNHEHNFFNTFDQLLGLWSTVYVAMSQPAQQVEKLQAVIGVAKRLLDSLSRSFEEFTVLRKSFGLETAFASNPFQSPTGLHMVTIWTRFRPLLPSTKESFSFASEVDALATRFDTIFSRENLSSAQVHDLKEKLLAVRKSAVLQDQPDQGLIHAITSSLDEVDETLGPSSAITQPHFQKVFSLLLRYFALHEEHQICQAEGLHSGWNQFLLFSRLPLTEHTNYVPSRSSGSQLLSDMQRFLGKTPSEFCDPFDIMLSKEVSRACTEISDSRICQLHSLNNEFSTLSRMIARGPRLLLSNQCQFFCQKMEKMVHEVSEVLYMDAGLHPKSDQSPVTAVQMLLKVMELNLENETGRLLKTFFFPGQHSLKEANNPENSSRERKFALSQAMVLLSAVFLQLYVPSRLFDPALQISFHNELLLQTIAQTSEKLEAINMHNKRLSSSDTSLHASIIETQLHSLRNIPQEPSVFRSSSSNLTLLQSECAMVLQIVDEVWKIVRNQKINGQKNLSKDGNASIVENLRHMQGRLSDANHGYDDLIAPILCWLRCMEFGLYLGNNLPVENETHRQDCTIASWVPFVGQESFSWKSREEILSVFNLVALLRSVHGLDLTQKSHEYSNDLLGSVLDIFHFVYSEWKTKLLDDQKKAKDAESIYRHQDDETQEFDEQYQIDLMFPTYYTGTERGPESRVPAFNNSTDAVLQVSKAHAQIFSPTTKHTVDIIRYIEEHDISLQNDGQVSSATGLSLGSLNTLPTLLVHMNKASKYLESATYNSEKIDFYTSASLKETTLFANVLAGIINRFKVLRQAWPEHMTIQEVIILSENAMQFSIKEPVARLIQQAELIQDRVHEWEVVASREFSASAQLDSIKSLIIRWRRLELSTWSNLFDRELERCETEAQAWWFIAYEAVIERPNDLRDSAVDLSHYSVELISILLTFLRQTTIGQYQSRIVLLKQIRNHLKLCTRFYPQLGSIVSALQNCIQYASFFTVKAQNSITEGRTKLQKEIEEVILLASWKDTNIVALRESARKSHCKLFRIVHRFRDLLKQSMESIFADSMPPLLEVTEVNGSRCPPRLEMARLGPENPTIQFAATDRLQVLESRPSWLSDPIKIADQLARKLEDFRPVFGLERKISEFLEGSKASIDRLREATPSNLTEANQAFCKHLKVQKLKLYAQTLRELRELGIRCPNLPAGFHKLELLPKVLMSPEITKLSESFPQLTQCNHNFLRFAHEYARIIKISQHRNRELSAKDFTKGMGFLDGFRAILLTQRTQISKWLPMKSRLFEMLSILTEISKMENSPFPLFSIISHDSAAHLRSNVAWIISMLNSCQKLVEIQSNFSGNTYPTFFPEIKSLIATFSASQESLAKCLNFSADFLYFSAQDIHESLTEPVAALHDQLDRWTRNWPQLGSVFEQISDSLNHPDHGFGLATRQMIHQYRVDFSQLDATIVDTCSVMLIATQKIEKGMNSPSSVSEDVSFREKSQSDIEYSLQSIRIEDVNKKIQILLDHLHNAGCCHSSGPRTLVKSVLPILQAYASRVNALFHENIELHLATSRLADGLTSSFRDIVCNGFCSPQEAAPSDSKEKEELEDGVGLGDGEGVEDISKDIQDDEDLSELGQDSGKVGDNSNSDDEDHALDMPENLEGEAKEDGANESDGGGSNNESPDENEDDVEEAVDTVDENENEVVDENTWNTEKVDEEKEKKNQEGKSVSSQSKSKDADKGQMSPNNDPNNDKGSSQSESGDLDHEESDHGAQEEDFDPNQHPADIENLDVPEDFEIADQDPDGDGESEIDGDDAEMMSVDGSDAGDNDDKMSVDDEGHTPTSSRNSVHSASEDEHDDDLGKPGDASEFENKPLFKEDNRDITDEKGENDQGGSGPDGQEFPVDDNLRDKTTQAFNSLDRPDSPKDGQEVSKTPDLQGSGDRGEEGAEEKGKPSPIDPLDTSAQQKSRADEIFKKLGDTLEKWHRSNRDIKNASDSQSDNAMDLDKINDKQMEYEHVLNDEQVNDTQAIGASSGAEPMHLDEDMAFENESVSDQIIPHRPGTRKSPSPESISDSLNHPSKPTMQDLSISKQDDNDKGEGEDDERDVSGNTGEIAENPDHMMDRQPPIPSQERQDSLESLSQAQKSWNECESRTQVLAHVLTEQLRLILLPTQATKMRGDFKTGKRLNIKRIIPYIASDYKRDKIWMRRSVPSKRNYQVMIAIDDSLSMAQSGCSRIALETLALVGRSLDMLEVGQISVVSFGGNVHVAHEFGAPFTRAAGIQAFQSFSFDQHETNITRLIEISLDIFRDARLRSGSQTSQGDLWQLQLIVSDGICQKHESIRRLVRQAREKKITIVFVLIDKAAPGSKESVLNLPEAQFEQINGETKVKMGRYMDTFPFQYYLVVNDINTLPSVLSQALRAWFSAVD